MKIDTLYNTKVTLEEGDLIYYQKYGKDKDFIFLWILDGNKVYKANQILREKDLEKSELEISVNSAGILPQHNYLYGKFEWKKHKSRN